MTHDQITVKKKDEWQQFNLSKAYIKSTKDCLNVVFIFHSFMGLTEKNFIKYYDFLEYKKLCVQTNLLEGNQLF